MFCRPPPQPPYKPPHPTPHTRKTCREYFMLSSCNLVLEPWKLAGWNCHGRKRRNGQCQPPRSTRVSLTSWHGTCGRVEARARRPERSSGPTAARHRQWPESTAECGPVAGCVARPTSMRRPWTRFDSARRLEWDVGRGCRVSRVRVHVPSQITRHTNTRSTRS